MYTAIHPHAHPHTSSHTMTWAGIQSEDSCTRFEGWGKPFKARTSDIMIYSKWGLFYFWIWLAQKSEEMAHTSSIPATGRKSVTNCTKLQSKDWNFDHTMSKRPYFKCGKVNAFPRLHFYTCILSLNVLR